MIVGGVAAGVTFVATPLVRLLALRLGWVVQPDERRVHTQPTPTLGGVAMFLGFLAAMAVAWRMDRFDPLFVNNSEPLGVVLGAIVMFGVGLADDLKKSTTRDGRPRALGAGQGDRHGGGGRRARLLRRHDVLLPHPVLRRGDHRPGPGPARDGALAASGMANAINLIDGLDGLAAGIVAIASGTFFLYGQRLDKLGLLAAAQHRAARGHHRARHLPRVPAPQLQPGPDLHGRLAARCCSGC